MKRAILISLAILLTAVPAALALWAVVPLDELIKETDVIVVARLTGVRETTKKKVNYGSGTLTVVEGIRGKAKVGDELRLEWSNSSEIICPRVEHAHNDGKTMIWLLQATNDTVRADYPGRVLDVKKREELNKLLKK